MYRSVSLQHLEIIRVKMNVCVLEIATNENQINQKERKIDTLCTWMQFCVLFFL